METWLQIVVAVVVVAVGGCLVPLILQLRRTARSVEALAESARADLGRIAQDIHETRVGVDKVVGLVERSLEFPCHHVRSLHHLPARWASIAVGGRARDSGEIRHRFPEAAPGGRTSQGDIR
jgi:hypothetical protein